MSVMKKVIWGIRDGGERNGEKSNSNKEVVCGFRAERKEEEEDDDEDDDDDDDVLLLRMICSFNF